MAEQTEKTESEVLELIDTFSNESHITLDLIIEQLDKEKSILEVGSGLCLLSLFLRHEGFNIVALEPALGGFGLFEQLKKTILNHFDQIDLPVLSKPAQELDTKADGPFDLLFSNNVIEHIPNWPEAMSAMVKVLNQGGVMVHACPNYTVPYEPHYGIPAFRHFPKLSRNLFLPSESDREIWRSLNFITYKEVKDYCNANSLTCFFRKELLYNSIKRISEDEVFKQRHQGFVSTVASWVVKSGLGTVIKYVPASLSTPMIIEITYSGEAD